MKASILAPLFLATANAYSVLFSFSQSTGEPHGQFDLSLLAALIVLASATGTSMIINEERKTKRLWFQTASPLE
ncbi:MAG TPA: hypothetical protein VJZ68_01760 [Nitrososphaera sp.]|nr:hypothetical protein [Nitrososphaera sp.]